MQDLENFFIPLLVFGSVALLYYGSILVSRYLKDRGAFQRRLNDFSKREDVPPETEGMFSRLKAKLLRAVSSLGHLTMAKEGQSAELRGNLLRAGYRQERALLIFWGWKSFLAALLPAVFVLAKILWLKTLLPQNLMLIGVLLALVGFYLPNLWLRMKIGERRAKILAGLPDALDLMVVCTEAGIGLDAAIHRVGEEMKLSHPVIHEEFKLLTLELRAGKDRREALKSLATRTGLEDVSSLVTLLVQTERFGTSVGQALRVHSDSMRTRRYQRAEETAAKLPVKLLFPLIFFIFPTLFVVILGPAAIRIFRTLLPTLGGQ
jgi:tight adherence protein C